MITDLAIVAGLATAISTTITLIINKTRHNDLVDHLNSLSAYQDEADARNNRLYLDLQATKERVNEDLVEHNKRLNRHSEKLTKDHQRLAALHSRTTNLELGSNRPS